MPQGHAGVCRAPRPGQARYGTRRDRTECDRAATGLPVLVSTSFNVHEEPIVNRPEERLQASTDGRVDVVVTRQAVYTMGAG